MLAWLLLMLETTDIDRLRYLHYPSEDECRIEYLKAAHAIEGERAASSSGKALSPMEREHAERRKEFWWAAWWVTWSFGLPQTSAEIRADWDGKCRAMVGDEAYRTGVWPRGNR